MISWKLKIASLYYTRCCKWMDSWSMQLLHTVWRITAEVETDFTSVVRVLLHAIKPASTHGAIEVACDATPYVRDFKLFERVLKTGRKLEFDFLSRLSSNLIARAGAHESHHKQCVHSCSVISLSGRYSTAKGTRTFFNSTKHFLNVQNICFRII